MVLAGVFEIGWPVGLKMSQAPGVTITGVFTGIGVAVVFMGISGFMLWTAQKEIPIGTAYAIWTGIGAAGTFILGIFIYGDSVNLMKILAVALIIGGVALLKLAH